MRLGLLVASYTEGSILCFWSSFKLNSQITKGRLTVTSIYYGKNYDKNVNLMYRKDRVLGFNGPYR